MGMKTVWSSVLCLSSVIECVIIVRTLESDVEVRYINIDVQWYLMCFLLS